MSLSLHRMFQDEGADLPFTPPKKDDRFIVPNGIRPVMVRTGIEVSDEIRNLLFLFLHGKD